MKDDLVEEVRAVRRKIFAEHGNDLDKLCAWLMRLQEQHPERMATETPRSERERETATT
jgi:hypothetical protein